MRHIINLALNSLLVVLCLISPNVMADNDIKVPILTYHNFDPSTPGSMTISTKKFEQQMQWLKDNGYTVIPLKDLVSYLQGDTDTLPEKSIVITMDDGRASVYKYMRTVIEKFDIPVTLFIYPSAISNASYAMTWDQLRALQQTGLFDIQGHTYWHPNFKQEKKKLGEVEYQKLVDAQLVKSKKVIDEKMKTSISTLAWPFGIYDEFLEQEAKKAGYVMAFSIDGRPASRAEKPMSQPRYMIVAGQDMNAFAAIASGQVMSKK